MKATVPIYANPDPGPVRKTAQQHPDTGLLLYGDDGCITTYYSSNQDQNRLV